MTKILAFSGKKGSGKDTSTNFLLGLELLSIGIIRGDFMLNNEGKLWVTDLLGNEEFQGRFELNRDNPVMEDFRSNNIDPYIKLYSFADLLKKEVCMKVLGLTYEMCYGSDSDKNTLTHLIWENMPGIYCDEVMYKMSVGNNPELGSLLTYHSAGQMTAREVMQFIGTDMFRKMYNNVWVDALMRQIEKDNTEFAIITDVRFKNEVEGVQKAGGKVIRLLRSIAEDTHKSEKELDDYEGFDFVLDNREMSIAEQNEEVYKILEPIGWVPTLDRENKKNEKETNKV